MSHADLVLDLLISEYAGKVLLGERFKNPANQALALTRNCKSPPPTPTTGAITERASLESAERAPTPPLARSSTPLENTISPQSIKEEFDPSKNISSGEFLQNDTRFRKKYGSDYTGCFRMCDYLKIAN
ncbi:unnamed protein product [Phaedon cochleariae]|uniref:Uncharacterized protein n=1 Tax=Phaedon cochleariae TaxID=80249 RepID=A0A9N9SES1_PHACE|nr:unnamed protein product [Phaedon cochleariae]